MGEIHTCDVSLFLSTIRFSGPIPIYSPCLRNPSKSKMATLEVLNRIVLAPNGSHINGSEHLQGGAPQVISIDISTISPSY